MPTLLRRSISSPAGKAFFLFFLPRLLRAGAVAFGLLFCVMGAAQAAPPAVTIVQSESGGSYQEFSNALRDVLAARGIPVGVIAPSETLPDSGLVVAVGMKAAGAAAASNAPAVLNVLVPKTGHEKLLHDHPQRAGSRSFSAIFLDQPVERQAHLLISVFPEKRRIGLLYSTPPDGVGLLRKILAGHGMSLHEQQLAVGASLSDALHAVLRDNDALLAMPDAEVYNSGTIRNILLATYRESIPLVGFSPAYVKAGALCAVFSTPQQIVAQADKLIRQFGASGVLPPAAYPQTFEVMVNEQVARSLGLRIKSAAALHDEILAIEEDER